MKELLVQVLLLRVVLRQFILGMVAQRDHQEIEIRHTVIVQKLAQIAIQVTA
jgi:hypothetical protein